LGLDTDIVGPFLDWAEAQCRDGESVTNFAAVLSRVTLAGTARRWQRTADGQPSAPVQRPPPPRRHL